MALEAVTASIALAYFLLNLSKERIFLHLRETALTDELTQIANRRAFFQTGEKMLMESRQSGRTVSLILIDLDAFKEINDKHGHPAGDQILRAIVRCISHSLRPGAMLARLGGDEFAVLLPDGWNGELAGRSYSREDSISHLRNRCDSDFSNHKCGSRRIDGGPDKSG